jgi:hypothetical protein
MKVHRILSAVLVVILITACQQSKVKSDDQSPKIEYFGKACVADFDSFVKQNSASILSNSFLGGLKLIYISPPKDTVMELTNKTQVTLQHAKSKWLVGLPSGDSTVLAIDYWKGIDTTIVLEDHLHPYSEFEKRTQASFIKVGEFYCSVFIRSVIDSSSLYLNILETNLLRNYISLLRN